MLFDEEEIEVAAACAVYLFETNKDKKVRKKRTVKTRLINQNRALRGFYTCCFLSMKNHDAQQFFKYTRMSLSLFDHLLNIIKPYLFSHKINLPDSIYPEQRLAIALQ